MAKGELIQKAGTKVPRGLDLPSSVALGCIISTFGKINSIELECGILY